VLLASVSACAACTSSEGGPEAVVRRFVESGKTGDQEAAVACLLEDERVFSNVIVEKNPELAYTIGRKFQDGEATVVPVTLTEAGDRLELEVVLRQEGGEWRISIHDTLGRKRDDLLRRARGELQDIQRNVPEEPK